MNLLQTFLELLSNFMAQHHLTGQWVRILCLSRLIICDPCQILIVHPLNLESNLILIKDYIGQTPQATDKIMEGYTPIVEYRISGTIYFHKVGLGRMT